MIPLVVSTSVDIAKTTFCWSYIFLAIIVPLSLSVVATGNTMLIYANAPCGLFEMNRNTIFNEVHVYKFMILQRCTCSVTVSFFLVSFCSTCNLLRVRMTSPGKGKTFPDQQMILYLLAWMEPRFQLRLVVCAISSGLVGLMLDEDSHDLPVRTGTAQMLPLMGAQMCAD